jgi:hypothetical protein
VSRCGLIWVGGTFWGFGSGERRRGSEVGVYFGEPGVEEREKGVMNGDL